MSGTWKQFGEFSVELELDDVGLEVATVYHQWASSYASLSFVSDNHAVVDRGPEGDEYNLIPVPHELAEQMVAWAESEGFGGVL